MAVEFEQTDPETLAKMRAPHSSRTRSTVCGCMVCAHYATHRRHLDMDELRWPIAALTRQFNVEILRMHYTEEQIEHWREVGLSDAESDEVAIHLGLHPYLIWRGWFEAALDWEDNRRI